MAAALTHGSARATAGLVLAAALSGGCADRVYQNGINHVYLCAIRVARSRGYTVRDQDFHPNSGTLVAARSTPDPRETPMSRGFIRRAGEVLWNVWDRGRLEFYDDAVASVRVRTEERLVVSFHKGSGIFRWLNLGGGGRTTVSVKADVTEYGREDWVIRRATLPAAVHDEVVASIGECLGLPAPSAYVAKNRPPPAPPAASGAVAAAASTSTGVVGSAAAASATGAVAAAPSPAPAGDPAELLAKGKAAYDAGKYAEAAPLLTAAAAADPDNAEALGYLGATDYQLKNLDGAIAAYERYVALAPSDARTRDFLEELKRERAVPAR